MICEGSFPIACCDGLARWGRSVRLELSRLPSSDSKLSSLDGRGWIASLCLIASLDVVRSAFMIPANSGPQGHPNYGRLETYVRSDLGLQSEPRYATQKGRG